MPKTSSTSCDQAIFVDQAINASLFTDAYPAGLLQGLGDPTLAADQFAGLVLYRPMNQAMFAGTDAVPPADTLGRIADAAVDVFLAS
jgi:transcriptional repressor AefR-like protein